MGERNLGDPSIILNEAKEIVIQELRARFDAQGIDPRVLNAQFFQAFALTIQELDTDRLLPVSSALMIPQLPSISDRFLNIDAANRVGFNITTAMNEEFT